MPYWPSSRVGAVPQQPSSNSKNKKRADKFGKKKGITMEDLKKQTAMRLAQEQQRHGRFKNTGSYASNSAEQEAYPIVEDPRSAHPPNLVPAISHPTGHPHVNGPSFSNAGGAEYAHHASEIPTAPKFDRDARFHAKKPTTRSGGWTSPSNHRDTPSSTYRGNSSEAPSAKQKSKLPHGLTVQELKEMTKARLQAEAADKVEDTRLLRTPEPLSAPPSEPRIAPPPTPPFRQGWNANVTQESWELASNAISSNPDSFANSDFQDDIDFKRARSYTDGVAGGDRFLSRHGTGTYNHPPSPSFYDHSMDFNQNRRRAATWSPRLGLSHVQEDCIVDGPNVMPSIPVNTPCPPPGLQARPLTPFGVSSNVGYSATSNLPFVPNQNRPRTSSAVSLPPMSHTADEFDIEPSLRASPFGALREESDALGLAAVFGENRLDDMQPVMNDLDFSDGLMESVGLSDELATLLNLGGSDDE